ncbi:ABC transporter ATP-binding protein [bacterium]|nr:ABC transporter ATP-binding protein [bacterium]
MPEPILCLHELKTHFVTTSGIAAAVDGINLDIKSGRTLCLVGESGSGKSVTALSILRLLESNAFTSGSILYEGKNLLDLKERELGSLRGGKIAMIFQEPATSLNPVQTIGKQITEAIRLHRRLTKNAMKAEVLRLLAETRIVDPARCSRQYPHELSGGMKQRIMIAMALAGEPAVLLADEPTTALDVTVQADILRLLRRIQRERDIAVLLITHDLGVVAEIADDVAVMYAGQIVEHGIASDVLERPLHPYTQGLLKSLPRIDREAMPAPIDGVVPLPTAWPSGCRFRPRCPHVFDRCSESPQALLRTPQSLRAACWLMEK